MSDTKGRPPRTQGAHHLKNLTTTHFLNIEVGRVIGGGYIDTALDSKEADRANGPRSTAWGTRFEEKPGPRSGT